MLVRKTFPDQHNNCGFVIRIASGDLSSCGLLSVSLLRNAHYAIRNTKFSSNHKKVRPRGAPGLFCCRPAIA